MSRAVESMDNLIADIKRFQAEHEKVTCPKTFHVYIIGTENFSARERHFANDMRDLGLAYCQKYNRWYWHNHLKRQPDFDLRDEKLIHKVLFPAEVVDLG